MVFLAPWFSGHCPSLTFCQKSENIQVKLTGYSESYWIRFAQFLGVSVLPLSVTMSFYFLRKVDKSAKKFQRTWPVELHLLSSNTSLKVYSACPWPHYMTSLCFSVLLLSGDYPGTSVVPWEFSCVMRILTRRFMKSSYSSAWCLRNV